MVGVHDVATWGDILVAALRRFPDRVAFCHDGRQWTYRQTEDVLARWVVVLRERGLRPGDGVGILSVNRPEAFFAQVAPALAGGRYTPLHPAASLTDHASICDDAQLRFLLADPAYGERAAGLQERCASIEGVFTFGRSDAGPDLTGLAERVSGHGRLERGPHGPDDVCALLYTGGTTGAPKGVALPERALAAVVASAATGWDLPEQIRYLVASPITHFAAIPITPTLLRGGTVVLQPRFDPAAWLAGVATERATLSVLVPTMIYALLDQPDLDRADLSSLRTVVYGASPIVTARLAEAVQRVGPVFAQVYGQIESGGQATCLTRAEHNPADPHRLASCGMPLPLIRVAVLEESGLPVAAGTPGEICLRGPSVMQGYWNQPELTAATLAGGWLHTGDVGTLDEQGYLSVVDRKKDMIITGGFNVYPREVEDALLTHPAVAAAAVIGVPDPRWGETVHAVIVLHPRAAIEVADLTAFVRERKGPIHTPKTIDIIDQVPLTSLGKPDKKQLRDRYWRGHGRVD